MRKEQAAEAARPSGGGRSDMLEVVAAFIRRGDEFLACQRPAHKARGLQWEFAGGKVEPGETKAQALARECREELGVELAVGDAVTEVTYHYPDVSVHLTLLSAAITAGTPRKLEHADIRWMTLAQARDYPFCPADRIFLEQLEALW